MIRMVVAIVAVGVALLHTGPAAAQEPRGKTSYAPVDVTEPFATTMARMKAGSIYYHFESKDEIIRTVLESGVGGARAAVLQAIEEAGTKSAPLVRFRAALAAHLRAASPSLRRSPDDRSDRARWRRRRRGRRRRGGRGGHRAGRPRPRPRRSRRRPRPALFVRGRRSRTANPQSAPVRTLPSRRLATAPQDAITRSRSRR